METVTKNWLNSGHYYSLNSVQISDREKRPVSLSPSLSLSFSLYPSLSLSRFLSFLGAKLNLHFVDVECDLKCSTCRKDPIRSLTRLLERQKICNCFYLMQPYEQSWKIKKWRNRNRKTDKWLPAVDLTIHSTIWIPDWQGFGRADHLDWASPDRCARQSRREPSRAVRSCEPQLGWCATRRDALWRHATLHDA